MILANKKTLRGTISQLRRPKVPLRLSLFGHAEKELGLKFAQTNVKIAEYILHTTEEEFRCFLYTSYWMNEEKLVLLSPGVVRGLTLSPLTVFYISK